MKFRFLSVIERKQHLCCELLVGIEWVVSHEAPSIVGFPGSLHGKESACNASDPGSFPGSGRCPGEGNGYPLQYTWLENSMDRGVWGWATVHGVTKSRARLSD